MQKDPGQARESVVTLQQSGPAEPGRGGVSSEGVRVRRKVRRGEERWVLHSAAYVGLRKRWGESEVKRRSSN